MRLALTGLNTPLVLVGPSSLSLLSLSRSLHHGVVAVSCLVSFPLCVVSSLSLFLYTCVDDSGICNSP